METTISAEVRSWAEQHIGTIQTMQALKGGISTSIYRLQSAKGVYVLRVIDNDEWLAVEPDLARHEAAALEAVLPLDIPTPQLIAYDDGLACSVPLVLSTWLPGRIILAPDNLDKWLQELADVLAKIHQ